MTSPYKDLINDAKYTLKQARTALNREITSYPTPISGCDAQFNHLLDERQRIAHALRQLDQPVFIPTPRTPAPQSGVESR